jgi:hypothetical protein
MVEAEAAILLEAAEEALEGPLLVRGMEVGHQLPVWSGPQPGTPQEVSSTIACCVSVTDPI